MLRKAVIFFTLISAYLLMLGHDIIPHHHHGHDYIELRDVHHDDPANDDSDDDHSGLPEFFAQYVHVPYQVSSYSGFSLVKSFREISHAPAESPTITLLLPDIVFDSPLPPGDVGKYYCIRIPSLSLRAPPAY